MAMIKAQLTRVCRLRADLVRNICVLLLMSKMCRFDDGLEIRIELPDLIGWESI